MDSILSEISKERKRQVEIWGNEFDDKNNVNDWSSYITRYNGNASFSTTSSDWRSNMIKVAALAIAALEAFDRNNGMPKRHYEDEIGWK